VITAEGIKALARRKADAHRAKEGYGANASSRATEPWQPTPGVAPTRGSNSAGSTGSTRGQTTDARIAEKRRLTGEHIVFQCPTQKLGEIQGWKDLDKPVWKGEGKDRYDAVEDFFSYCNHHLSRRQ